VGKKNFILSNNIIDGGYTDAPDCYNAGINIAAPVMDIWPAGTSTLMENIVIEGNIFKNLGFFAVFTGGTTTTRHKGLVFKGNTVDTAPGALQVYRAENVTINGNVCRRIAKFGTPNISGNCFDINWVNLGIISDNIIDGNEILTIGGAERKLYGGIMAYSCKKLTIANNVLYGAGYSFIHCPAEDDSGYGDLSIINNQGWDARGTVTVAPFVLGTDKAHRLQSVKFAGNTYNGKLASGQNTGKFSKHFADWPDCVQVKLSEGQSIKPGKVTVVAFDAKNYDLNEVFNTATHRFQPSQRGVYQIASQVVLLNVDAATYAILYIYKNNSLEATLRQEYCPKSQHSYLAGSAFVFLNGSSDYLDIRLVHESASVKILSNNADASRFEARFLAPQ
jgi:hypothetical protein